MARALASHPRCRRFESCCPNICASDYASTLTQRHTVRLSLIAIPSGATVPADASLLHLPIARTPRYPPSRIAVSGRQDSGIAQSARALARRPRCRRFESCYPNDCPTTIVQHLQAETYSWLSLTAIPSGAAVPV